MNRRSGNGSDLRSLGGDVFDEIAEFVVGHLQFRPANLDGEIAVVFGRSRGCRLHRVILSGGRAGSYDKFYAKHDKASPKLPTPKAEPPRPRRAGGGTSILVGLARRCFTVSAAF